MRQNRFILALLVMLTGLFILAPQAYTLYRFYVWHGETVTAIHRVSNQTKNSKDTVMMPIYQVTRANAQTCEIAVFEHIHALDKPPHYTTLQLKLGKICQDYVILNDFPRPALILFALGFLGLGFGLHLTRLAWRTA